jgi:biotin transport system substrate-specific component
MNGSRRLLILSGLFTALTVFGAQIKMLFPFVPFTLQTFFVLLSGLVLGPIYGAASQLAYLFLGLLGLPVFSEGSGVAYIFKPSFGYLAGFPLASFAAGLIGHRRLASPNALPAISLARLLAANFTALFCIFIPGVFYLWVNLNFVLGQQLSPAQAVSIGFLRFLFWDVIKMTGVILLYRAVQPRLAAVANFSADVPA